MSDVIDAVMLIKVDGKANNNKFYEVKLYDNNEVSTRWGRVGAAGTTKMLYGGRSVYESTVRKKKSRGYKDSGVEVDSGSIVAEKNSDTLKKVALSNMASDSSSPNLSSALDFLAKANRHDIIKTSGGKITADESGLVKTPLGVLSGRNIQEAGVLLDRIEKKVTNPRSRIKSTIEDMTTEYFSIVPHKLTRRDWATSFFKDQKIVDEERELLRQLRTSADLYAQRVKTASAQQKDDDISMYNNVFSVHLQEADRKTFDKYNALYNKTKRKNHSSRHMKMKALYTIENNDEKNKEFNEVAGRLGNVMELWHGSSAGNILSILREGLYCPPMNAHRFNTTGRMFGDGVYAADVSTKALNYSQGFWHGSRNDRCFMFVIEAVMGNVFYPHKHPMRELATRSYNGFDRNKYNSIHAVSRKLSILNDEMIIWNKDQIRLTHLAEFTI